MFEWQIHDAGIHFHRPSISGLNAVKAWGCAKFMCPHVSYTITQRLYIPISFTFFIKFHQFAVKFGKWKASIIIYIVLFGAYLPFSISDALEYVFFNSKSLPLCKKVSRSGFFISWDFSELFMSASLYYLNFDSQSWRLIFVELLINIAHVSIS